MSEYDFSPYKKLTQELINKIIIHSTLSSLRRAGAYSPKIIRVESTKDIPTLFYIKKDEDLNKNDWEIHAMIHDLWRWLARKSICESIKDPDCPDKPIVDEFTHSKIELDTPVVGYESKLVLDGGLAVITGKIKWNTTDEREPGNYGCLLITPSREMIKRYPEATIDFGDPRKSIKLLDYMDGAAYAEVCRKISSPGEEFPININWCDDFEENIVMAISQDIELESD